VDYVRAWKDPLYRASFAVSDRQDLPPNPAGTVELTDNQLRAVHGQQAITFAPCTITWPYPTFIACG
jgi:mersacidin/lichenicidin family type 2 lantibiotic